MRNNHKDSMALVVSLQREYMLGKSCLPLGRLTVTLRVCRIAPWGIYADGFPMEPS